MTDKFDGHGDEFDSRSSLDFFHWLSFRNCLGRVHNCTELKIMSNQFLGIERALLSNQVKHTLQEFINMLFEIELINHFQSIEQQSCVRLHANVHKLAVIKENVAHSEH